MINTNASNHNNNTLKHNTMKKRIILATIAVAIIAGVSIFAACTKEENKENKHSQPFVQNKDYVDYFNNGTVVVATYQIGSTADPVFNFNYDDFVSQLEDTASLKAGYDVILEDIQIIDDSLRKEYCQGLFKMSFYCPTLEQGASYYFALDKTFGITGSEDEGWDTIVYYAAPNSTNNTVWVCDKGTCKSSCRLHLITQNGQIIGAYCTCKENNGSCEAVQGGWLHDLAVAVERIANSLSQFFN